MTDAQEQPKRRLPRFSLLTLIVAVNVAGVLVWLNVGGNRGYGIAYMQGEVAVIRISEGWPWSARSGVEVSDIGSELMIEKSLNWHVGGLALDVLIAGIAILVSASLTEFLVRKLRKAKRHDG